MTNSSFIDKFFKLIHLMFWPIIWYKLSFISSSSINDNLFYIFFVTSFVFVILIIYSNIKNKISLQGNIYDLYRLGTTFAFMSSLYSMLIVPKDVTWLLLKILFTIIYFYVSFLNLFKAKSAEGVVGLVGSTLLFVITIFY